MFFILSKTVGFLLLPSNFLLLLALAGAVLLATRWRRAGLRIVIGAVVLLAIVGLLPVGTFLIHGLESRFPQWDAARGTPDGIIVLGNAISPKLSSAFGEPVFNGSGSRMLAMAKLARAYPNARIVYSGGDASLFGNGVRETDFVYPALESLGIARERVQLETQSRNTAENAAFTKAAGESKTRRALAACDIRTSHAACDRLLPEGRLSCRGLSGWLVGCGRSGRANGGEDWRMAWSVSMPPRMSGLVCWLIG